MMSKKILVIPSWYPNTENELVGSFFQEQARILSNNGFDVKILYGEQRYIKLFYFITNKLKNIFLPTKVRLQKKSLIQNPEAFSFSVTSQYRIFSEKKRFEQFFKAYEDGLSELIQSGWKPDLIHAQCTVDAGIVANYLSKVFKIPYVIIEHRIFLMNWYSKFKQKLIINALQEASKVGAVSNHQKRCILMNSIKCDPVIIWNFVDEKRFKLRSINFTRKFRIITITYPNFIKDVETFFKSVAIFCQYCDNDIEIVVVGNSSFANIQEANIKIYEGLAVKYGITSKIKLISHLSREEISQLLSIADVFISTSIAETFGVAVREAMSCGVPVIATKSGGVEDSINERTGVLVNIGDYEAIAEALLKIENRELIFDTLYIRNFVISQCGEKSFLKQMTSFYS